MLKSLPFRLYNPGCKLHTGSSTILNHGLDSLPRTLFLMVLRKQRGSKFWENAFGGLRKGDRFYTLLQTYFDKKEMTTSGA